MAAQTRFPPVSPRRAILKKQLRDEFKTRSAKRREQGPATMAKPGREGERASSHWLQGAQRNRSAGTRGARIGG